MFSGLSQPTAVQFASDGRVFIAEKSGRVKVFPSLSASTPTVFADLRTNVHNFWDRGLLGMALHPNFPATPYVYVLYTYDAVIGGTAPRWGDVCPTPPGPTTNGCVVSGRLSRLEASGNVMTGPEQVLIEGWCQQYPSHSVGSLVFGADGALYVSGGDGASFSFVDFGQQGNPCGDPPNEGGALRSQSIERPANEPVVLNGTVLRVDPDTGDALPDNPLFSSADLNERRIVAYGLRNPFRITDRPGTSEIWIGDVGWGLREELDRIPDPRAGVLNFGWPCYEGNQRESGYDGANLGICESLYQRPGAVTAPAFSYRVQQFPSENCASGTASVSGLAFYGGSSYPAQYDGALFFSDYSRKCIWVMFNPPGSGGTMRVETFLAQAAAPVDLKIGPNGDLFYVDFDGSTLRRIVFDQNQPPNAVAQASALTGPTPLKVNFDATSSTDPDPGDSVTYQWDLDGDGQYDDSTAAKPTFTYNIPGTYTVRLRVTDNHGAFDTDILVITVGQPPNTPPSATITAPSPSGTWAVGTLVSFSGNATDTEDGPLPASALSWSLILHHCPSGCHAHPVQDFVGVAGGSFNAPDHDYPAHLEVRLTATDSDGATNTQSVLIFPQTVTLSFDSNPSGAQLTVGSGSEVAPFSRTVIVGSNNSLSAASPQVLGGLTYN
ncbi:MAG: PQQ-dependent sugar dehydrogenase, partial [Candidatus Binatia bacterium]